MTILYRIYSITFRIFFKVANKKEVVKIQDEFFEIYKRNNLNELRSFARQLDIMAEGYRAQSY